jgi:hypothetical protein
MALSKVNFNSMNVTPAASKAVKFNSSNNGLETGDIGGNLVLLSTQTASSSATLSFTSGIDSTYKEYIFKFINCHPANNDVNFQFNLSIDGGSNYNVTKTTTRFTALHSESDDNHETLAYEANRDMAQSTVDKILLNGVGNGSDESCSGVLHLFDPSSTTFVKHFIARAVENRSDDTAEDAYGAGYANTTSAVNAIVFKFGSGNIDSGTIKMYGVL